MTLGGDIRPVRRIAGRELTWGKGFAIPVGLVVVDPIELVRASVGGPCAWTMVAMLEGGAPGDTAFVLLEPGIGSSQGKFELVTSSAVRVAPLPVPSGIPATELVISVRIPVAFVAAAKLTVTACPLNWPHWANPAAGFNRP